MALPNKPVGELRATRDPEVDKRDVDVLIIGGGMAAYNLNLSLRLNRPDCIVHGLLCLYK